MAKMFMRVIGIVFVILGIVGFVFPMEGLFHLTYVHNVIHLVTGVIALGVSGNEEKSAVWSKIFGYIYLIVSVLGLFVHNIGGYLYLLPADNILHFILTVAFLYVGYRSSAVSKTVDRSL